MALFEPGHENVPWPDAQYGANIRTQAKWAPSIYSLEAAFSPLMADLGAYNYETGLLGSEAGSRELDYFTLRRGRPVMQHTTVNTPGSRGYLDIYENEIAPSTRRISSGNRAADVGDVETLAPRLREAIRTSSPDITALLDELYSQASGDLKLGADLNSSERRNIEQGTRAGQSARGMGFGPNDSFEEALYSLDYGRGLQRERRGFAGDMVGMLEGFYGDMPSRILGRDAGSGAMAANLFGQTGGGRGGAPQMFHGESPWASSIYGFNASAANADKAIGQEQWAHMMDQIKDSMFRIGSMAAGGMGGGGGDTSWSGSSGYHAQPGSGYTY